jgi:hypothetical protein
LFPSSPKLAPPPTPWFGAPSVQRTISEPEVPNPAGNLIKNICVSNHEKSLFHSFSVMIFKIIDLIRQHLINILN